MTDERSSDRIAFTREVADRFGVLPNFFCSADAAPGSIEELWTFAKSAYLDSPLPSLFKERLFVHLSRFCRVRYSIVRHAGFLLGHGRPAGDATAQPETVDQVIELLRRPQDRDRATRAGFDAHLTKPAEPAALRKLLSQCRSPRTLGRSNTG